jgi:hypothetical protein
VPSGLLALLNPGGSFLGSLLPPTFGELRSYGRPFFLFCGGNAEI